MEIHVENAFTINRLGGSFFPLSLKVGRNDGQLTAFFCALRVVDVCDCIEDYALERLAVWGVDQTAWFHEDSGRLYSLRELAGAAGAPCAAIDEDAIVLASADLRRLLETFSHANLCAFDLPPEWNELDVTRQILTCQEWRWGEREFVLAELPASRILILSHDDCYLTLYTNQEGLARRIFARLLATYARAVWAELAAAPVEIPEVSDALLDAFWGEAFGLCIPRQWVSLKEGELVMGVAPKPYNFREEETYPPAWRLRFNAPTGEWSITHECGRENQ